METNQETNFLPQYTIEEFAILSPAEKRRAIARDAINQIRTQRFFAESGVYLFTEDLRQQVGRDLREVLLEQNRSCSVCGLGACFASMIRLENDLVLSSADLWSSCSMSRSTGAFLSRLQRHFEPAQLELIECAFEISDDYAHVLSPDDDEVQRVVDFGDKYAHSDQERLLAILNEIANDEEGEFHP